MPLTDLDIADTSAGLRRGLERLSHLETVGVDVERADWDRYFRSAALIQVGGAGEVLIVDPLALDDLDPLHRFLAVPGRRTVLHALENDLGPLHTLGVAPPHIEDTSIAAAVLGLPTGLEALLRDLLGVELDGDKQAMQRADWEARPLQEAMLTYAAGDVADLPQLWTELAARLEREERGGWYAEELAARLAQPPAEERRDWRRIKGAGRLDPPSRARLQQLWHCREELARRTDTAPNRIVADKTLVKLAAHPPRTIRELAQQGMRRQAVRRFGERLLAAVHTPLPEPLEPPARERRPVTDADRELADRLRELRAEHATALGIDPGVLCPSRTLLGAVLADPASPEELRTALGLRDWQWRMLGADFCALLGLEPPSSDGDGAGVGSSLRAVASDPVSDEEGARHG